MKPKDWADCKEALRDARYILLIPVFFILVLSHVSRAMRWRILMKPLGYFPSLKNTFCAVMVGYLANLAVPRLGEVLKCTILGKYEKVPADKLIGTILVERAVDVISLLIIFAIALIAEAATIGSYAKTTLTETFFSGSTSQLVIKFGIIIISLIIIYFLAKYLFKRYSHTRFINKIKNIITGIGIGLSTIKLLENKWTFIFHSVLIWCCYIAGTYIGFFAIKETGALPFGAVFPVLAFASVGMILTPGGIGAYALFIKNVMMLYGIKEGFAFANGNLQWMAQFGIILIMGFLSLIALPYINRDKKNEDDQSNTG